MPLPFPGMDPWLEDPTIWSGVHPYFLAEVANQLSAPLRTRYAVRLEERVYVETETGKRYCVPDVTVRERDPQAARRGTGAAVIEPITVPDVWMEEVTEQFVNVIDLADRQIVTVIGMLSPTNKTPGADGRRVFQQKKREVLSTPVHWVEIDLLRGGERTRIPNTPSAEYQVYVSRAGATKFDRTAHVWPIPLAQPLPPVRIPLREGDTDIELDLQAVLTTIAERGSYDLDLDHTKPCDPPLTAEQAAWAAEILTGTEGSKT